MSIYSNVSNIFGFNCTKCEYNRNCYGGNMGNQYKFCQKSREKLESLDKLEQENQKLKDRLNTYENPEDLTLMFMYCDEKAKDKIKCLEQKNQQLKEQLELSIGIVKHNMMIQKHVDRERKLQKKIEAIEKAKEEFIEYLENKISELNEITKNEEDEETIHYALVRITAINEILLTYKKIIGGKNEN